MKKNPLIGKGLAVGIILLFLSTTCLPIVNASEGKPDFVIEDIFLWPSAYPYEYHFECSVRNIGNASNYWNDFEVYVKIKWLLFGKIPLLTINSHTDGAYVGGQIEPNETIKFWFIACEALPKFGTYRFSLTVNPNLKIEESDYDNNKYSEDWKVFLWDWKEI